MFSLARIPNSPFPVSSAHRWSLEQDIIRLIGVRIFLVNSVAFAVLRRYG